MRSIKEEINEVDKRRQELAEKELVQLLKEWNQFEKEEDEKAMERCKEEMANQMFGRSRKECFDKLICVTCGKEIDGFRNNISLKEYRISGMCQECQDGVFGED